MALESRMFLCCLLFSCIIFLGTAAAETNGFSVKDEEGKTVIPKSMEQTCNINGKEYSEGAEMLIPNDWTSDVGNAKCMKCRCAGGKAEDCKVHMYCDTLHHGLCSKWRNATGECCPVCDCYHDGKMMELGSTWVVREGSQCSECTCGENKVAKCTSRSICICLGDSIPVPGKCCPKCVS